MRPVEQHELLDYQTYSEQRDAIRKEMIEVKRIRRIYLGEVLTFLFENRDTVRYQVHEMMRTESIVRKAQIQHELDTYNELLGKQGGLGATLLIEIDDEAKRDVLLKAWLGLPHHLYIELADGTRSFATFDPRQIGTDRLSSVQYLHFDAKGTAPVAIGCDMDVLKLRQPLTDDQREALAEDLA